MFLHLSVSHCVYKGVCLSACWDTHVPQADTPWTDTPQADPPDRHPQANTPLADSPPYSACWDTPLAQRMLG